MSKWEEREDHLYRRIEFKDFIEAWGFMNKVALIAEKQAHHPNWNNVYNTVKIRLNTHDAGDVVTEKDRKLAAAIDRILE